MNADDARQVQRFNRWYIRLFRRVGWGWDMPTLAMCEPGVYNSFRRLCDLSRPLRQRTGR